MKISITHAPAAEIEADAIILAVLEGAKTPSPWEALDAIVNGIIAGAIGTPLFNGKSGQTHTLPTFGKGRTRELVLVGLGPSGGVTAEGWRRAVADGCKEARARGASSVAISIPEIEGFRGPELAASCAEAAILASYRYQEYKQAGPDQVELEHLIVATVEGETAAAVERSRIVAEATCWARDLVNRPGNAKRTPALAELAMAMASEHGLQCELLGPKECEKLGLNAMLAVGGGSDAAPRLLVLEHRPEGTAEDAPIVLVGKGITFDSGGISIKPSKGMEEMKADMAGAAAVFGTMRAVAELRLPRRIVGLTPLAENLLSATSYRPGDIVRAYGGTTIEVVNTDAEGRLVLADALAYGRDRFQPACMVDLATLTGACVVALGSAAAGLMGNEDSLCEQLREAGEKTGERLWRLPIWEIYDKIIDSDVSNVKNSGGRDASVITAAKFLQRFVGDTPWAHLDIAGTAYINKQTPYQPKGATGFGVRLLTRWLQT
ncbi:MAG: leucyl aminopeptidase [Acidobacteriota bacterium]